MININIGLLGHVDSGKTSLAKALSRTASTAAFDKSPQSQTRGITLDLGFSAREVSVDEAPFHDMLRAANLERALCTLVDCPGHASLLRTIAGGAQIIDVMVLLIDATKGVQSQTAECLVLGEVLAKPLLVVINKIDAVQGNTEEDKRLAVEKLRKRLTATFRSTRWPRVSIIEVAASPRTQQSDCPSGSAPLNTEAVLPAALALVDLPALKEMHSVGAGRQEDFLMLVDHCFAVRGHGTVLTGTVLNGAIRVGDSVFAPELQVSKKVKGLQVFRKPVDCAQRGDRVGLCVGQLDPSQMERGVLCADSSSASTSSGTAGRTEVLIAHVHRVRFHSLACDSQTKYHVTIGHQTVMGTMRYFSRPSSDATNGAEHPFDMTVESSYEEELSRECVLQFDYKEADALDVSAGMPIPIAPAARDYYAIVLLDRPVYVTVGATLLAMRLDVEEENLCRIAASGTAVALLMDDTAKESKWRQLPIIRWQSRQLRVDRVVDERTCIADGVVSATVPSSSKNDGGATDKHRDVMHAEVQKFVGLRVQFVPEEGEEVEGVVDSTFGRTGKVKLRFSGNVFSDSTSSKRKSGDAAPVFAQPGEIVLRLKKYPLARHAPLQQ